MSSNKKITVICTAFNHEEYISEFIQSVLDQTYSDWQLLIIDDCSTDRTVEIAESYKDNRIQIYRQPFNQGPGAAYNRVYQYAEGDIIVDLASDDKFRKDYFEFLAQVFDDSELDVVYPSLNVIGLDGKVWNLYPARCGESRESLIKQLFDTTNILYSPGFAARRSVYANIIPMDPSLVQHQDYQWHIKLLVNARKVLLTQEPYVYYRFEVQGKSLGSFNLKAFNRNRLEIDKLMDTFLEVKDMQLVEYITQSPMCKDAGIELIPFILGQYAMTLDSPEKKIWGYKILCNAYDDDKIRTELYQKYNFVFKDFLGLSDCLIYQDKVYARQKRESLKFRIYHSSPVIRYLARLRRKLFLHHP